MSTPSKRSKRKGKEKVTTLSRRFEEINNKFSGQELSIESTDNTSPRE